jgi:multidrug efflux pump
LDLSSFKLRGETYDVIAQLERSRRSNPRDVTGSYVRGRDGRLIPLSSVVSVRETIAPRGLPHFDRLRSARISANLRHGAPLGQALDEIRRVSEEVLPEGQGYRLTFSGESEQFYESGNALLFAYILAVIIVYLVLAAQFESFLLFSQIGLVMLVGLVTKNSILIVEFANQLRARGRSTLEAIREASRIRFRPILMTALATSAGILPLALGRGAGGEARAPLGIAVVGGVLFASLLSFFVVPATYLAFDKARIRLARWLGRAPERAIARG